MFFISPGNHGNVYYNQCYKIGYYDMMHKWFISIKYLWITCLGHFFLFIVKAVLTPFSPDILNTEETKSFDVSCKSTGSRPAASMYWLLGQQNNDISSNSSTQSIHNSTADVNTVTSNLKYRVDRRYNGQKLICRSSNVAGEIETFLTLNIKCKSATSSL